MQSVKGCVEALKALRADMHADQDPSVKAKLDDVILRLERCTEAGHGGSSSKALGEALDVVAMIIKLYTDVSDLISRMWQ